MLEHTDGAMAAGAAGAARRGETGVDVARPDGAAERRLEAGTGPGARGGQALPEGSPRAGRGGPLRVGALGHPPDEVRRVVDQLQRLPEVELCDPHAGRPQVILCVAGSAWRLVEFLDPLVVSLAAPHPKPKDRRKVTEYRAPVALLDLLGEIGPQAAALHALHGYLAPALRPDEWLPCLRSAARGRPYAAAPEELAEAFLDAWTDGPLTALERQILGSAALGFTQAERAKRLHMGVSTLDEYERALKERLEMDPHQHLAAAAVELGFYRQWPLDGS